MVEVYKILYVVYLFPYFMFCLLYFLLLNFNSFFKKSKEDLKLDMKMIVIKTLSLRNQISIAFWLIILLLFIK